MPPSTPPGETIAARLIRLSAEHARVSETIARIETNGTSFNLGGVAVTELSYDRALKRRAQLETEIKDLEIRAAGATPPPRSIGVFVTRNNTP